MVVVRRSMSRATDPIMSTSWASVAVRTERSFAGAGYAGSKPYSLRGFAHLSPADLLDYRGGDHRRYDPLRHPTDGRPGFSPYHARGADDPCAACDRPCPIVCFDVLHCQPDRWSRGIRNAPLAFPRKGAPKSPNCRSATEAAPRSRPIARAFPPAPHSSRCCGRPYRAEYCRAAWCSPP